MSRPNILACAAAMALAAPLASPLLAQIVSTTVSFPKGQTGTTISATLKGEETRDYVVRANAGQIMRINISGSANAYFNVLPPGSNDVAIHNSSTDGNSFVGTLSAGGNYRIRVYQMRATGRRGESAPFKLAISVTGGGAAAGNGGASGSGEGSIAGIEGMDGIKAFDTLQARGFVNVDSFSSGDTLYGVYLYRSGKLCIQTTSANGVIIDIRDIKTHPKCR